MCGALCVWASWYLSHVQRCFDKPWTPALVLPRLHQPAVLSLTATQCTHLGVGECVRVAGTATAVITAVGALLVVAALSTLRGGRTLDMMCRIPYLSAPGGT